MITTSRTSPALLAALLAGACFSGESPKDTAVPRDSGDETDADTDSDADTDTDTDTDTQPPTHTVVTIQELQQGLIELEALVMIEQVVVVGDQLADGFHVVEPSGGESYAGIWVGGADVDVSVVEGDLLEVAGRFTEIDAGGGDEGDGTVSALMLDRTPELLDTADLPEAVVVSSGALGVPDTAEPYEGMLLRVEGVTVSQGGSGSWWIDGTVEIGSLYHEATTLSGASLDAVVGVLWYEQGRFLLCPRSDADLLGYDPLLDDCGEAACVSQLAEGGLVITEIMRDPEAVFDDLGEWFEIFNPGEQPVDLRGLEVSDDDSDGFTVTEHFVVESGAWAVLASNADSSTNGGLTASWDYPYSSFTLADGGDELVLAHSGMIFDRVAWDDSVTFPGLSGVSMTLDSDHLDADSNDDGAFWCDASSPYGEGDLGTPGSANDACVE